MKVQMLLVDKGSHRYRHTAAVAPALPDVVLSLEVGQCAHYNFRPNETGNMRKVYCTNAVVLAYGTGLLCEFHQRMLAPASPEKITSPVAVDARSLVTQDKRERQPTDLYLADPVKMRRITNKRPANHWEIILDQYAADIKAVNPDGITVAAIVHHLQEDLGWDIIDPRAVHLLKHFSTL